MKRFALFAALIGLAGCAGLPQPGITNPLAPISTLTASDMQTAAAIANMPSAAVPANPNAIDPAGAMCFGTMGPIIGQMAAGRSVGLFSQIEALRVLIIASRQNGACALLAQPILAQLSLLPGAGNAIAIAATTVAAAPASLNGN